LGTHFALLLLSIDAIPTSSANLNKKNILKTTVTAIVKMIET
jgi:hypothetical protein